MIEKKPTPLPERITLKGVKEAGGEETPRFEAKMCLDGEVVAHVSNGGIGGCHSTYWERGIHADPPARGPGVGRCPGQLRRCSCPACVQAEAEAAPSCLN